VDDVIRVGVAGAAGRMGETVCEAVESADDTELAGRADPALDQAVDDAWLSSLDVMVDFTTPDEAPQNIVRAVRFGVHAVVGTTGWDTAEVADRVRSERTGDANVLYAPNFAIGAVLLMRFVAEAARHMPEVEIIELHHDRKLDAPSGTAKRTSDLIASAGGNVHEPIHSVRLPGLVAHQEVIHGGAGQTLTIRHDSIDRTSFMPGVLLAVRGVASLPDPFTEGLEVLLD
jgi:4-hydroxy-tetrahydrodipicolinate reductase